MKREDYISWDEYFMGIAILSSMRSKDPGTCVGACVVDSKNRVLSLGYNGMPVGCNDDDFPWEREGSMLNTKYAYVCHAELNAILNYEGYALRGSKLYVTLFPCNECSKAIIQKGIKEVIYLENKYGEEDFVKASKMMLDAAGVEYRQYTMSNKNITIEL